MPNIRIVKIMRIGVDIRVLMDEKYSGVSEYAANLLAAILSLPESKNDEYKLFYNSRRDLSARLNAWNSHNAKVISTAYSNKIFNYLLQKTLSYPKIDKIIGGADIFFSPHFNFSSFSSGDSSPKKIITVHDLSFLRYPEFFSCRKNYWHKLLNVKKILREADYIIAVSASTKDDIVELVGLDEKKISVIHSGINFKKQEIKDIEIKKFFSDRKIENLVSSSYILYLGNIEPRKNIVNLIKAYEILRASKNLSKEELNNFPKLVLAGHKGWKHKAIFKTWRKSIYKSDIIFTGYIDENEKEILYKQAKVFAYPSFYEGFGFPPLEAMVHGLPCLTSNISSLPEVVGDAALMIDPNKIEEIASALDSLLFDENLRTELIERGYKRAAMFSWEEAASKYIKIFKNLSDEKNSKKI